jgi:hypothetical protein
MGLGGGQQRLAEYLSFKGIGPSRINIFITKLPDPDPGPYLWLMDPDPNPTPDPTPLFNDFKDVNRKFFIFFPYNLPTGHRYIICSLTNIFC